MSVAGERTTTRERLHTEPCAKRIRAYLGGELVADTTRALLVWESPAYPTYYLPAGDVREELLEREDGSSHSPSRGDAAVFAVRAGGKLAAGAALRYADSPIEDLRGLIRLDWGAMDAWFEEDEEVYTHARDPHKRVDILQSSRHVRVVLEGETLAESPAPRLLFETSLPTRYYLPRTHVRMDLLELSDLVTHCAYKGAAQSFDVRLDGRTIERVAWSYPTPLREGERIAGLIAFYNERVDLHVDGVLQQRPTTPFSS
jgi:uncharacterized protein (DUF427 family)